MSDKTFHFLGKDFPRKEGRARVTGREVYPSDVVLPGMLYGKILRSPHPHARIKRIDFSGAERLGAVVLAHGDTPQDFFNVRQVSVPRSTYKDWRILSDHVRQVGDPYAAVAAETEELAEKAAEVVQVEWELLPAYFNIEEAMAAEKNLIHDKVYLQDKEIPIQNNIACTREVAEGDVEKGFAEADVIVENEFVTPRVYHCQMEPRGCTCRPEPDGVAAVAQCVPNVGRPTTFDRLRRMIAAAALVSPTIDWLAVCRVVARVTVAVDVPGIQPENQAGTGNRFCTSQTADFGDDAQQHSRKSNPVTRRVSG